MLVAHFIDVVVIYFCLISYTKTLSQCLWVRNSDRAQLGYLSLPPGFLMLTPTSGVRGVVDAANKFTRTAEVLWRKRDGMATL